MSADADLTFPLARTLAIARERGALPKAPRPHRLTEIHGRVTRALAAQDRCRHAGSSATVDAELRDALLEFANAACGPLGLEPFE